MASTLSGEAEDSAARASCARIPSSSTSGCGSEVGFDACGSCACGSCAWPGSGLRAGVGAGVGSKLMKLLTQSSPLGSARESSTDLEGKSSSREISIEKSVAAGEAGGTTD